MENETIIILQKLLDGRKVSTTKDSPEEMRQMVNSLANIGILYKIRSNQFALEYSKRKYLAKLVEINSWSTFLDWLDKEKPETNTLNDFSGSNIGQVSQAGRDIHIENIKPSIKEKVSNKKSNWIKIGYWVVAILAGLLMIYEFILKNL